MEQNCNGAMDTAYSTFTYNQQSFAVYLFLLDYPDSNLHPVPSAHISREQIAAEYEKMLQYAMENYPWDVTGYWWISHDMNELIDALIPENAQEVDKVTDKINYNLGSNLISKQI